MSNLSEQKRNKMLAFLKRLKEKNKDDQEALIAITEIEAELNSKKYGLIWEKHEENVDIMIKDNVPVFTEVCEKEIIHDSNEKYNFLLEGDNLHSLKLLEKTHKGKIDVIYIDPPYNTKNKEFRYNDKMIGEDDGYRHSKWLSFMSERLELTKKLLSERGSIFISIDENEFGQLKLLCDSIFGEENFIGTLIWRKKYGGGQTDEFFVTEHEYIFGYRKTTKFEWFNDEQEIEEKDFKYEDNKGKYSITKLEKWGSSAHKENRPTMYFPIKNPDEENLYPVAPDGHDGRWRVGKERMEKLIKNDEIHWEYNKSKKRWIPYEKNYMKNSKGKLLKSRSIIYNLAETGTATKLLTKIFGKKDVFPNPKPIELISFILKHVHSNIVLDFFAGSGTTGHAVMQLNKEDGGNRTYIMCTNNENNICEEVTYQRMKNIQNNLPHNLKYYKTNFISKKEEELSSLMLKYIKEMIQLEHRVKIDGTKHLIIMKDEEADNLEKNISNYPDLQSIYVSSDVLLTSNQKKLFSNYKLNVIPDYYFSFELREAGKIW